MAPVTVIRAILGDLAERVGWRRSAAWVRTEPVSAS
jgi:hypothetical protein